MLSQNAELKVLAHEFMSGNKEYKRFFELLCGLFRS